MRSRSDSDAQRRAAMRLDEEGPEGRLMERRERRLALEELRGRFGLPVGDEEERPDPGLPGLERRSTTLSPSELLAVLLRQGGAL